MDSCLAVEREVDKVISKFNSIKNHSNKVLNDVSSHVESLLQEYQTYPSDHQPTGQQLAILREASNRVKNTVQYLTTDHRDLHRSVSTVGKAIDRHFISDFDACGRADLFDGTEEEKLLNQSICQHFYQQGMLDIAEYLAEESGLVLEEEKTGPFCEINRILDSLKQKDVSLALEWTEKHKDFLRSQNSCLEFKLHQLKFVSLIQKGMTYQNEAMQYARTYLIQHINSHEKEIQNLMGMFLYLPQGLCASPYAHYLTPTLWLEINEIFMKDACNLLGLSMDSPLSICVNAGCATLPSLLNIKHLMLQRQVGNLLHGRNELPVEIDIGSKYQYHSVFSCPILRQQSTPQNPPMRLYCGHVISKDALIKLTNHGDRLKCPYCPVEQVSDDAMKIIF